MKAYYLNMNNPLAKGLECGSFLTEVIGYQFEHRRYTCVWDVLLSTEEIELLEDGAFPLAIRPFNIKEYERKRDRFYNH